MFRYYMKKLTLGLRRRYDHSGCAEPAKAPQPSSLSDNLQKNLERFRDILGDGGDVKIQEFRFGPNSEWMAALIYIDGLVNSQLITESILKPLVLNRELNPWQRTYIPRSITALKDSMLCSADAVPSKDFNTLVAGCLSGDAVMLCDGLRDGLAIAAKGWDKRSVSEPQTEPVERGPREGFTENFRSNTALIRRRIKSPQLRMEHMTVGERTVTNVCIAYIEGVAHQHVLQTLRDRIASIQVDGILDSAYIEQYIEDHPFSIFPTIGYTEKPDVAAGRMLEGRIVILVDGSPFALTVPMLFIESFQTAEDYIHRPLHATFIRLLRFGAFILAVAAPALYIAFTSFHQELIPTTLLLTIADAREGTPFSAFIESLIMVTAFEILREAGLRLPRPVGQAVSIVGALIMGEASVSAGIVGAPMVIVVAITSVAGSVVPELSESISLLRIALIICAALLGGFGIAMGVLAILVHLATLQSFGTPYYTGIALLKVQPLEDSYFRAPLWTMVRRPLSISGQDTIRRGDVQIPPPPSPQDKGDQPS